MPRGRANGGLCETRDLEVAAGGDVAFVHGLVQAVRDCPFLSRRVTLLRALADGVPEGAELLARLISDPQLGPVVLLAEKEDLSAPDASPEESAPAMTSCALDPYRPVNSGGRFSAKARCPSR